MQEENRTYIAIDLKSFYASVECVERGLDPLNTNLVVADASRTEKTICLAVSPSLKAYGIPGRARLFEVVQKVRDVNAMRRSVAPGGELAGSSCFSNELAEKPALALDYIVAPPQMRRYMEVSTQIYQIYLRFIAPEDIHVYSVDEVFMDVTSYLRIYGLTPHELALKMVREVFRETGITATAGIGTNMYLSKVAMDIVAKHMPADEDGVRIAELDVLTYRRLLWDHRPLTDFWRVGHGYAKKLAAYGMHTMGDICRCSLGGPQDIYNEDLLYRMFGVNAELLIDHAWGIEPCTIAEIKAYKPETNSVSLGQVLPGPYDFAHGRLIVREMTDLLVLDLVDKGLVTDSMVLTVGYDINALEEGSTYEGEVTEDRYGRKVPKQAHGTQRLKGYTSSTKEIMEAVTEIYERIVDPSLQVRRMYVVADHVISEAEAKQRAPLRQLSLFDDPSLMEEDLQREQQEKDREKSMQKAVLEIKKKFGKNAVLKGMNLEEGGTTIQRNAQVGGHKA